jgi:AcrR family transcriptional regulator
MVMSTAPREGKRVGRPRSDASRQAILDAMFRLLIERGYDATSIEAVAALAGVGKTTVYRWWPCKAAIAVEAFFMGTEEELRFSETGSAREDFRQQITALAELLKGDSGQAFAAMLGGARADRELAEALKTRWLDPRRAWGFARMTRAKRDGELRDGVDPRAALGLLYSPLYTPLLFDEEPPSGARLAAVLGLGLAAVFK